MVIILSRAKCIIKYYLDTRHNKLSMTLLYLKFKEIVLENYEIYYLCEKVGKDRATDTTVLANTLSMKFNLIGNVYSILRQSMTRYRYKQDKEYHKLKKQFLGKSSKVKVSKRKSLPNNIDYKWKKLRKIVLHRYGCRCMRCGITPTLKSDVHVDHIKPKSKYPDLKYEITNLQVLCSECNIQKSNLDCSDYRTEDQKEWATNYEEPIRRRQNKPKKEFCCSSPVKSKNCLVCKLSFYPLNVLVYRAEGYCSEKCYRKRFKKRYRQ